MLTAERLPRSGKVRDIYELPDRRLVLVASDRISAFDVILPTPIPDKGRVLTGLSRFWFDATRSIIRNHLLDTAVEVVVDGYAALLEAHGQAPRDLIPDGGFEAWRGRLMVCRPAQVIPIEAVVRGYLSGSGWKEYRDTGRICGIELPAGMRESDRLPEPIFTPASKAPAGRHDENLTFDAAVEHIARHFSRSFVFGRGGAPETFDIELPALPRGQAGEIAEAVRDASLRLYRYGAATAAAAGILLADTKFEFGLPLQVDLEPTEPPAERIGRRPAGIVLDDADSRSLGGRLMLIDEVLTPDSSRFWETASYAPGGPQASYDKQFVRDWLEGQPWDKTAPGPELPDEVVAGTRTRYVEAFERIAGASFDRYLAEDVIGPAGNDGEEAG
jgi:phosphoribosylaminoimidazole-succinocarboxamide synthase